MAARAGWEGTMCESNVFLATDEGEELILEDVTFILPQEDGFLLTTLFGERKHVRGKIKEMDLLKHRVVLEPLP